MDPYIFTLALGGAGLAAMAVVGAAHLGGGANTGHDTGALASGHGHLAGHVPATGAHLSSRAGARHTPAPGTLRSSPLTALLTLMSPRVLFTLLLGFGITGLLVKDITGGLLRVGLAVIGAFVLERVIVSPLWNFLFRFASRPAMTLEGSLLSEAHAATTFDANGQGIVALEVDGQIVQCLGTLREEDRSLGIRVNSGDIVRVEDVDAKRNQCTVAYVGHDVDAQ